MDTMIFDDELEHIGMPRRSGRYPWGSGDDPYQRGQDFLARVETLKKSGWKETPENIMEEFGITTTDYRTELSIANSDRRMRKVATAKSLKDDGLNNMQIGEKMGVRESTVRSWFNEEAEARMNASKQIAETLRAEVDKKGMVDIGVDVERELNISKEMLREAAYRLEIEGYHVYSGRIPQPTNPGQHTTQKVLCVPGTEHSAIYDYDKVHSLKDYISRDGGVTLEKKFTYPASMDSKRLQIRYNEDGGVDKDGIVELRRGVADLSLGESRYSQVRILVDGSHYIKGMAVYSDNMPPGVDVVFNTNKTKGTPMSKVLKEIKDDPDNPFGSAIKDADQGGQYWYDPKTGSRVSSKTPGAKLGLINKRADEGDWSEWKDALPSQFLGKQSLAMAKKQLNLAKADKQAEFDEINSLNNPTIKKHLLEKFADTCDSAAVHLQAAALPGQKYHVIVPINTLKENEVYAPNYETGTKLALIRYPHGGTFEIPVLTVNNKHLAAKKLLGTDVTDAVGIHKSVADKLSGADFDGDTVMCIPTHDRGGKVKIASRDELPGLKGFDPKLAYPARPGMKYMKDPVTGKDNTQKEMGVISNLITDMTLGGANDRELAQAVRHSMVVIDAGKHKLDYKKSEEDNNIASLKKKYQRHVDADGNLIKEGGAATILSRAKGEYSIPKRQGNPKINQKGKDWYDPSKPEGSLIYKTADDLWYPVRKYDKSTGIVTLRTSDGKKVTYSVKDDNERAKHEPVKKVDPKTGEVTFTNKAGDVTYKKDYRKDKSTNMGETDNPYTLVSAEKHPMELAYAEYASTMKSMANKARMEMVRTTKTQYSAAAKKAYQKEVDSLNAKLNEAQLNAPRERAAQRMAVVEIESKKKASPNMKKDDVKKISQQALSKYRHVVGTVSRRNRNINITDREWEAIQAGAISESKLKKILNNTDIDKLRERATPRSTTTLSSSQITRIKAMSSTYTIKQLADKFGVSPSAISKYIKE